MHQKSWVHRHLQACNFVFDPGWRSATIDVVHSPARLRGASKTTEPTKVEGQFALACATYDWLTRLQDAVSSPVYVLGQFVRGHDLSQMPIGWVAIGGPAGGIVPGD